MIIFKGTKSIREDRFMIFTNEQGSSIDIPISKDVMERFLRYFDRLSPPEKAVEGAESTISK